MNFRKTMFFILCMLTVRCHAGNFFLSEEFGYHNQIWLSKNFDSKRKPFFREALNKRVYRETACKYMCSETISFDMLEPYLGQYPFVRVEGDDLQVIANFLREFDQRYKLDYSKTPFDENSYFMSVNIFCSGPFIIRLFGGEGMFFKPLLLPLYANGNRLFVSNNFETSEKNVRLLQHRLSVESPLWTNTNYHYDYIIKLYPKPYHFDQLISHFKKYPFVIVSGNDVKAVREFMDNIKQKKYRDDHSRPHFNENSNFIHVHVEAKKTIISFYGT